MKPSKFSEIGFLSDYHPPSPNFEDPVDIDPNFKVLEPALQDAYWVSALEMDNAESVIEQMLLDHDRTLTFSFPLSKPEYLPVTIVGWAPVTDTMVAASREIFSNLEQVLNVEITESEMVKENDAFFAVIEDIRAAGIRLALDDFGAGYAGLSLLADLMPDKIKLDRAITRGIHESGPRQAILHSVFEFANATGSTSNHNSLINNIQN